MWVFQTLRIFFKLLTQIKAGFHLGHFFTDKPRKNHHFCQWLFWQPAGRMMGRCLSCQTQWKQGQIFDPTNITVTVKCKLMNSFYWCSDLLGGIPQTAVMIIFIIILRADAAGYEIPTLPVISSVRVCMRVNQCAYMSSLPVLPCFAPEIQTWHADTWMKFIWKLLACVWNGYLSLDVGPVNNLH